MPFFLSTTAPEPLRGRKPCFSTNQINQSRSGSLFNFLLADQQECPSQRRRTNQPILPPTHLHPTPAHCTIIHSPCGPNPGGSPRKRLAPKVPQIHSQLVMRNQKWERRSKGMSPLKHPHHRPPARIRSKSNPPAESRAIFEKRRAGTPLIAIRWFVTRSVDRPKGETYCLDPYFAGYLIIDLHHDLDWTSAQRSTVQPQARRCASDATPSRFFPSSCLHLEKHGSITCLVSFYLTNFAILCRHITYFQFDHL